MNQVLDSELENSAVYPNYTRNNAYAQRPRTTTMNASYVNPMMNNMDHYDRQETRRTAMQFSQAQPYVGSTPYNSNRNVPYAQNPAKVRPIYTAQPNEYAHMPYTQQNQGYQAPVAPSAPYQQPARMPVDRTYVAPQNNVYVAPQNNAYEEENYDYSQMYIQEPIKVDESFKRVKSTKKKSTNKMAKLMVAVYFFIISVCAALILINIVAGSSAAKAVENQNNINYTYSEDTTYFADKNGEVTEMSLTAPIIDYSYDESTNWFDKMCDTIGKWFK